MEMCYDGALVMPSSYAVMDEEDMYYVEGGASRSTAKKWAIAAFRTVVCWFGVKVVDKVVEGVVAICAGWVKRALETAILTIMCYPEKVTAVAVGVGILSAAGYTVFRVGRNKGRW